jgi:hypothetical protein
MVPAESDIQASADLKQGDISSGGTFPLNKFETDCSFTGSRKLSQNIAYILRCGKDIRYKKTVHR